MVARIASYFGFMLAALCFGLFHLDRCDYLLTESPPLFLGITGWALARGKSARWIFNVSDLWPESAVRIGVLRPGLALYLSEKLEAFCYRHAWLVSGQSASILDNIRTRFPTVRTYHFSNGVNTAQFTPARRNAKFRECLGESAHPIALYAGLHGLAQGLEQVLEAARLRGEGASAEIFLLGDGPTKRALMERAREAGLTHLHFLDAAPADEMPMWVASSDIALVLLKNYIPGAVPSKLYEAMASGVPVILAASGEAADIVRKADAGLVVQPGDAAQLADALDTLARNRALRERLGANGWRAAVEHYDRRVAVNGFIDYLEQHALHRQGAPLERAE
jgi:glycosyltransferase involved in cell wall biosynthesis